MTETDQSPVPRRRWLRATVTVLMLAVVAGGALASVYGPDWVDKELRRRITASLVRRGFDGSLGTIDWSTEGRVTVHGLRVARDGVVVTVDSLTVHVDPWEALRHGTSAALQYVEVGAIEVATPTLEGLEAVRHWRSGSGEADAPREEGTSAATSFDQHLDGRLLEVAVRVGLSPRPRGLMARLAEAESLPEGAFVVTGSATMTRTDEGFAVALEGELDARALAALGRGRIVEQTPQPHRVTAKLAAPSPFRLDAVTATVAVTPPLDLVYRGLRARGFERLDLSADGLAIAPLTVEGTFRGHAMELALERLAVRLGAEDGNVRLPRVELTGLVARAPGYPLPASVEPAVDAQRVVVHFDRRVAGLLRTRDTDGLVAALSAPESLLVAVEAEGLAVEGRGHRFGLDRAALRHTEAGYIASAKGRFGPADAARDGAPDTRALPTLDATVTLSQALRPIAAHVALTEIGPDLDPTSFTKTLQFDPRSRADLLLDMVFDGPTGRNVTATGLVAVRETTFQHWRIAPSPVGPIDARASLSFALDRDLGIAKADITGIEVGSAHGDVHLILEDLAGTPRFDVRVHMPKQDCQGVADAMPRGLIATLGRLDVTGTAWFDAHLAVDLGNAENLTFDADGSADECLISSLGGATDERIASLSRRFTFYPNINGEKVGVKVGPATHNWVPRKKIPAWLFQAALSTEDGGFYTHGALREGLMRGALKLNFKNRRYVYGGSTITQQLVKNLFLTRHKNLARKLEEAIIATQLERVVSKDRILELYMNCIEYGPKIWGIRAGAKAYFAKEVEELTPIEGIWLMAIKPYPVHAYYVARDGAWNVRWVDRMRGIFEKLVRKGVIAQADMDAAGPSFKPNFAGLGFAALP